MLIPNYLPFDGEVFYFRHFLNEQEANQQLLSIRRNADWKQNQIKLFGKLYKEPRLTSFYTDPNISYRYSGLTLTGSRWLPSFTELRSKVESFCNTSFNSLLVTCYRSGDDHMGYHRDNEKELGHTPVIAAISLGQTRQMDFLHDGGKRVTLDLHHGSLLIMKGMTQNFWKHRIRKSGKITDERISLTFRTIYQF